MTKKEKSRIENTLLALGEAKDYLETYGREDDGSMTLQAKNPLSLVNEAIRQNKEAR